MRAASISVRCASMVTISRLQMLLTCMGSSLGIRWGGVIGRVILLLLSGLELRWLNGWPFNKKEGPPTLTGGGPHEIPRCRV
ncbi:hypothetical protein Y695_04126 [Hydrogenophaga sp. T4]|nr:hypothetical protein Y695_04126 [Hydrogenophaga sp. T4]